MLNLPPYNPAKHYWFVGGDETRAWSSAVGAYVSDFPEGRVTRIKNEIELYDVLAKAGLAHRAPQGPFSVADIRSALVIIDAAATGAANDAPALQAVAASIGIILPPIA
jgi:hypothetical protein